MDVRYPIGKYEFFGEVTPAQREVWIKEIAALPARMREAVAGLSEEQLDLTYREGGWSLRQVVHHVADTSVNFYVRFKLALTADTPIITIQPFSEEKWAELADSKGSVEASLSLLEGLHNRWVILLRALSEDDYEKSFFHPSEEQTTSLAYTLGKCAWHGNHHMAQITSLRARIHI